MRFSHTNVNDLRGKIRFAVCVHRFEGERDCTGSPFDNVSLLPPFFRANAPRAAVTARCESQMFPVKSDGKSNKILICSKTDKVKVYAACAGETFHVQTNAKITLQCGGGRAFPSALKSPTLVAYYYLLCILKL